MLQQPKLLLWRTWVQDEVRISHRHHQCQLPGRLLLEQKPACCSNRLNRPSSCGLVGGETDACTNCLGYILDARLTGQCRNTVFFAYMLFQCAFWLTPLALVRAFFMDSPPLLLITYFQLLSC